MAANRQVRLDPDVVIYLESIAYDLDCSLSSATNRILREFRDTPTEEPVRVPGLLTPPRTTPPRSQRVPKGVSPRLAEILRANAARP